MWNLQRYFNKDSRALSARGRTLAYLGLLSFVSVAASGPLAAQGVKISALPDATSAGLTDMIPCVQGDTTRRCTPAEFLALLTGGVGIGISSQTISTASNEADFLISGALTCGASTQGKVQVHSTTPLQYCDNAGTPTLRYAAYGNAAGECLAVADNSIALGTDTTGGYAASVSEAGPATTASAAASDPANCSAGSVAGGVDASWVAQDCLDPITETELDSLAELNTQLTTAIADGPHTVDTDDQTASEVAYTPIDGTDWTDPDPDDVADGLDKLADRLTTEEAKADDDIPEDADLGSGTPSASTWLRGDRTWSSLPADDDIPESGDFGALALTGPVTSSGVATSIVNDAITEPMLKSVNGPTDELCLSYESTTGDFEWQECGVTVNSFETVSVAIGTSPVADSATDTLTLVGGGALTVSGDETTDTVTFSIDSSQPGFLQDGDTTSLTCGSAAEGKAQVLNNGKLEYCDGNGASTLRSGYLDADGVDDDLPDADEIVESMLKAVDVAVDEECLTYETTTGDFEWQACAAGGSGDVVGPASATDECFARYDTTTGKLIQNSVVCATDAGVVTGLTKLTVDNIDIDGNLVISINANGNIDFDPNGTGAIRAISANIIGQRFEDNGTFLLGNNFFDAGLHLGSAGVVEWNSGTAPGGGDLGIKRSGINELDITDASTGSGKLKKLILSNETLTIADNGGGTKATSTLTPTKSVVECTCNDTDGCTITMGETGMVSGWDLTIINVGTNTCEFADTAGVSELSAAFIAGQYDTLKLMYTTSTWVEVSRSDN